MEEKFKDVMKKYCDGRIEEAAKELCDLVEWLADMEVALRILEKLHVFFEDGDASIVSQRGGVFIAAGEHQWSVRIRPLSGKPFAFTFTIGGW